MNRLKQREWDCWEIIYSIALNTILIILTLLFFEPTTKVDDYDMCTIFYGGTTGQYSEFFLYGNVLIGCLIKSLLMLFPKISWYYVILYFGVYVSLNLLTYTMLTKAKSKGVVTSWICIMVLFSYELYVRLTFTKVAGVVIATGLIFIFNCITMENKRKLNYLGGIIWITFGIMIRSSCFELVLFCFISLYFYFIFKIRREKRWIFETTYKFVIIIVSIVGIRYGLNQINLLYYQDDEEWSEFVPYNAARANLFDYGIPDYMEHIDEYEKLGITQNDYELWFDLACISDGDLLTIDLLKEIREIIPIKAKSPLVAIYEGCHTFLNHFFNNTLSYAILLSLVVIIINADRYGKIFSMLVFLNGILGYLYMYYRGRIQYHTNVVLYLAITVVLYYIASEYYKMKSEHFSGSVIYMIAVLWFITFYNKYSSSSYYEKPTARLQAETYESYRETMDLISEDKNHVYILGAYENEIYYCFTPFEIIPKDYYSNIYRLNHYSAPNLKTQLKKYKIENIFKDIVDSDVIYYAATEERESDLETITKYIEEHFYEDVEYQLVKTVGMMNIYKFLSE